MKTHHLLSGLFTLFVITNSYASQQISISLQEARAQVIKHYVADLEKADYKSITQLFNKNGSVISTSRGNVNAKEFFYSFLPEITSAHTELHQTFSGNDDTDRMAARFHFAFKLKSAEEGDGEYVDEFVFDKNSTVLSSVYMFENLKFNVK